MDLFSYLLGKKSSGGGGGTDLSDYFVNSGYVNELSAGACIKKIPFNMDLTGITIGTNYFLNFKNLESISIRNGDSLTNVYQMFAGCNKLMFIDVRDIIFHTITASGTYNNIFGTKSTGRVPYTCLVIVKDDTEKAWFTERFPSYTNVKTVDEYENSGGE